MKPETITCICLTYGRPRVLEEAIESFLLQQYPGPCELLIVNDHPAQHLACDAPGIRIINLKQRIEPLGRKYNFACGEAHGTLFAVWEDDDIYLPWRLATQRRMIWKRSHSHTRWAWFERPGGELRLVNNLHHCNLMVRRHAFERIGGYSETIDHCSFDADFMRRLRYDPVDIPDRDVWYIYRWAGTGSYHGSALGQDMGDKARKWVESHTKETGTIQLVPRWTRDWTQLAFRCMASNGCRGDRAVLPGSERSIEWR